MKPILQTLLLALVLGATSPAVCAEELVLIVGSASHIEPLESPLIRKLFLGLTVTQNGARLHPVLNEADSRIKELFLQNVVSMSDSTYDRYVLRLALLQGQAQPMVFHDSASLLNAVAADSSLVGYAWATDIAHDSRIRVLRIVWHD